MIKQFNLLLITVLMLSACVTPTYAGEYISPNEIKPCYVSIQSIKKSFYINNRQASIKIDIRLFEVDKASAYVSLQQLKNGRWTTIKTWDQSSFIRKDKVVFLMSYPISSGSSYRYLATIKTYDNGRILDYITYTSNTKSN